LTVLPEETPAAELAPRMPWWPRPVAGVGAALFLGIVVAAVPTAGREGVEAPDEDVVGFISVSCMCVSPLEELVSGADRVASGADDDDDVVLAVDEEEGSMAGVEAPELVADAEVDVEVRGW